ncbi:MAG: arginine--tRNA ligase [Alphaproteobacteria bacterium]
MKPLAELLSGLAGEAFAKAGLDPALGRVQPSARPDLGDFQCNGALPAAKQARRNPREIAEEVAASLRTHEGLADVNVAGPGFINLTLSDAFLSKHLDGMAAERERLGVPRRDPPRRVLIDFGGPNIAKPMHVGHLRSSIIGDSLQRLFRFAGDEVVSDVHLGDWGLPMGMLISEIAERDPGLPYFDPQFEGPYPERSPVSMDDLERLYPEAAAACKADAARRERARRARAELQEGRPGYRALWQHFTDVSIEGMKREFAALGVKFDLWEGEASVDPLIGRLVEDLKSRGVARESEGAWIIPVGREDDKTEVPPFLLVDREGAALYGTTDLATIVDRLERHRPDLMLYVVDQRQHLHFEQVFRAARIAGLLPEGVEVEHVGFGTMNGPDGRPFKTRAGGVLKLQDLIGMAVEKAEERLAEAELASGYGEEERARVARQVAIAAIKFADLSNWRASDYVFDLDRFTRFEGKTGPYLQYAAVRIKSILRKAEDDGQDAPIRLESPAEHALALKLAELPDAVARAYDKRAPNALCDYIYDLAQSFSRFYTEHHILSEPDAALRASRLTLARLTLRVLERVLGLLGIEVPERM